MRKIFIPESFTDEATNCPTCQRLVELDESLLTLQQRRDAYASALRGAMITLSMSGHDRLATIVAEVHRLLDEFVNTWRDEVEVNRAGYGYNLFLYFTAEEFDGLTNRLRKGVQGHEQCVQEAQARRRECESAFAQVSAAHSALILDCLKVPGDWQLLDASFQSLAQAQATVQQCSNLFWQQMQPWMVERRKGAFKIL